ncbi:MAG: FadR/GntR family transcriptional regulator [Rhodospirillales bacterium]|nr:FadR/GntR family transcriptional regulator [Rhodospirillales bacterium]MDE0378567.1 FadR/GntR family transcriptional regulator [Rhodospirillales bacterium]
MNEHLFYDLKEKPALTRSLATQIVQELGRRIVAGAYGQGDLLEDEGALAARYQVSRSVIRDAVKILVGKGLLEVRRGIGTRVRSRSAWALLDDDVLAWHQSAPVSHAFLQQLTDLRLVIEPKAARWAAERGTAEGHALIAEAQARMEQEKGSIDDFIVADALFHRAVLRAADNEFLLAMESAVFSALLISIRLTNRDPRENEESIPFHRAVADAILARDAAEAEARMERLLADARLRLGEEGARAEGARSP